MVGLKDKHYKLKRNDVRGDGTIVDCSEIALRKMEK